MPTSMPSNVRVNVGSLAVPTLLFVWSFLFVGFLGTSLPDFDARIRVATAIVYVVPVAMVGLLALRGPRDALESAILVALGASLVVAMASIDQVGSLEALGLTASFGLLFWVMRVWGQSGQRRSALAGGAAAAIVLWLVIAAASWMEEKAAWILAGGGWPDLESQRIFGWSSPNTFPVLVLLAVPLVYASPAGFYRRGLTVLLAATSLIVIPFSVGRAGYLGIGVALVAFELLRGAPLVRRALRFVWRNSRGRVAAIGGAAIAVGLLALLAGRSAEMAALLLASRVRIWNEALSIFLDRPLTGGGPSTFPWLRLEHAPDYGDRVGIYLAHNAVIQTIADGGLLLTAAFALVLGAFALTAWRRRATFSGWDRMTLAVLIGYGAASLLDDFSTFTAVTAIVVTLTAWVAGPQPVAVASSTTRQWVAPVAIALLAAVTLPAVVAVAGARLEADAARASALNGNWPDAVTAFRAAAAAHPADAGYQLGLGLSLAEVGDDGRAVTAYDAASRLASGDPRPYGALAALRDNPDDRVQLLDLASRRTIRDPQYAYRLGLAQLALGELREAARAFALAVVIEPRLFGSLPEEMDRDAVAEEVPSVLRALAGQEDVIGEAAAWDVQLAMGALPEDAGDAWQAVAAAVERDPERALGLARSAVEQQPHDPRSYQALAYAASSACDVATRRGAERLEAVTLGATREDSGGFRERWDPAYREEGLGDYQPPAAEELPPLARWPLSLVPPAPECAT